MGSASRGAGRDPARVRAFKKKPTASPADLAQTAQVTLIVLSTTVVVFSGSLRVPPVPAGPRPGREAANPCWLHCVLLAPMR
jgi:hypothetical protein